MPKKLKEWATYVKGWEQYSQNMVTIMSKTIFAWKMKDSFRPAALDETENFSHVFVLLYLGLVGGCALNEHIFSF